MVVYSFRNTSKIYTFCETHVNPNPYQNMWRHFPSHFTWLAASLAFSLQPASNLPSFSNVKPLSPSEYKQSWIIVFLLNLTTYLCPRTLTFTTYYVIVLQLLNWYTLKEICYNWEQPIALLKWFKTAVILFTYILYTPLNILGTIFQCKDDITVVVRNLMMTVKECNTVLSDL